MVVPPVGRATCRGRQRRQDDGVVAFTGGLPTGRVVDPLAVDQCDVFDVAEPAFRERQDRQYVEDVDLQRAGACANCQLIGVAFGARTTGGNVVRVPRVAFAHEPVTIASDALDFDVNVWRPVPSQSGQGFHHDPWHRPCSWTPLSHSGPHSFGLTRPVAGVARTVERHDHDGSSSHARPCS